MVRDMTALMSTMTHDSDVAELSVFTRRWCRLRVSAAVGASVTIIVLGVWMAVSPTALRALPVGTVALLALMLYDRAELSFVLLFMTGPLLAREARYDHKLFRLNPVDALPVQRAIRSWEGSVFVVGLWTTLSAVLDGLLVGLTSPSLVTVVAGFTLTGYAATLVSWAVMRSSMRGIVRRVHDQTMEELQGRIEAVNSRGDRATSEELQRMRSLVELYTVVRDAPTSPRASHTLAHAAGALAIPTLGFFLAILSEVYAERLLDQLLP